MVHRNFLIFSIFLDISYRPSLKFDDYVIKEDIKIKQKFHYFWYPSDFLFRSNEFLSTPDSNRITTIIFDLYWKLNLVPADRMK